MRRIGVLVLVGALLGLLAVAFGAPGLLGQSLFLKGALPVDGDWRALPITAGSGDYRVLFELDAGYRAGAGNIPRLKIEQIVEGQAHLICEYERDGERANAQRFDSGSGRYLERLDPALFRPLAEAMQGGAFVAGATHWTLGDRLASTEELALRVIDRCTSAGSLPTRQ